MKLNYYQFEVDDVSRLPAVIASLSPWLFKISFDGATDFVGETSGCVEPSGGKVLIGVVDLELDQLRDHFTPFLWQAIGSSFIKFGKA